MTTLTAAQVRRDAITRLIVAAEGHRSYTGPYDPDRMRTDSIDLLWRWASANAVARGDEAARVELDLVYPVARGDAGALYDAVQAGGIGALVGDDRAPAPTLDEFEDAVAAVLGGVS